MESEPGCSGEQQPTDLSLEELVMLDYPESDKELGPEDGLVSRGVQTDFPRWLEGRGRFGWRRRFLSRLLAEDHVTGGPRPHERPIRSRSHEHRRHSSSDESGEEDFFRRRCHGRKLKKWKKGKKLWRHLLSEMEGEGAQENPQGFNPRRRRLLSLLRGGEGTSPQDQAFASEKERGPWTRRWCRRRRAAGGTDAGEAQDEPRVGGDAGQVGEEEGHDEEMMDQAGVALEKDGETGVATEKGGEAGVAREKDGEAGVAMDAGDGVSRDEGAENRGEGGRRGKKKHCHRRHRSSSSSSSSSEDSDGGCGKRRMKKWKRHHHHHHKGRKGFHSDGEGKGCERGMRKRGGWWKHHAEKWSKGGMVEGEDGVGRMGCRRRRLAAMLMSGAVAPGPGFGGGRMPGFVGRRRMMRRKQWKMLRRVCLI